MHIIELSGFILSKRMKGLVLRKLCCCVGGEVKHENLLSNRLIRINFHRRLVTKLMFGTLAPRQSDKPRTNAKNVIFVEAMKG